MSEIAKKLNVKWDDFVANIKMPVIITDSNLKLLHVNPASHHLFTQKLFPQNANLHSLIHESEKENFEEFISEFLKSGKQSGFDEFRIKSRSSLFVMMSLSSIPLPKNQYGFIIFLNDVTGRKNNVEQLRLLLDQKEDLFAKIHYYQQEILKMVVESEEKERKMIADNIHDRLGSLMASIRLHLEYYEGIQKENQMLPEHSFTNLKLKVDEAIHALRLIAHETMPVVLDLGITAALDNLIFYFSKNYGATITVKYKMEASKINHSLKVTIYRIVQDLLKYSLSQTTPHPIILNLITNADLFVIKAEIGKQLRTVKYNQLEKENIELKSIYQRVHLFRGNIRWRDKSTDKTKVLIEIPLDD